MLILGGLIEDEGVYGNKLILGIFLKWDYQNFKMECVLSFQMIAYINIFAFFAFSRAILFRYPLKIGTDKDNPTC